MHSPAIFWIPLQFQYIAIQKKSEKIIHFNYVKNIYSTKKKSKIFNDYIILY